MTIAITQRVLPTDPEMKRVINRLYDVLVMMAQEINTRPAITPIERQQIARDTAGLLGGFGTPLVGAAGSSDPLLETLGTGNGTVTSVDLTAADNLSASGGPITDAGALSVTLTDDPLFNSVAINGMKWIGKTASISTPTAAEYPSDNDGGIHEDTAAKKIYLAFNYNGAVLFV